MANGPLNRPKLPGIPGIEIVRRATPSTPAAGTTPTPAATRTANLTGLRDKRVGIIGTGATAVQCVPHLGAAAEHLYVFQRTPSSIDVRGNRPTDPEWAQSLEPGWQQRRMDNFNILVTGGFQDEDLVSDGWTDIIRKLLVMAARGRARTRRARRHRRDAGARRLPEDGADPRAASTRSCSDPATAEALKPYYRQFCKRPCFHDEYLQTRSTGRTSRWSTPRARASSASRAKGVVVDGIEYELDCLIYATGFEVGTDYTRRAGYEIVGRDGVTPDARSGRDGVRTLHGIHSRGFPNCFIMGITQAGFTVNFPHMLNEQSQHIAYIVAHALDHGVGTVEATQAAEDEWVETIVRLARARAGLPRELHARLLQQRGQAGRAQRPERLLRRRLGGVLPHPARVARGRRPAGPGAHAAACVGCRPPRAGSAGGPIAYSAITPRPRIASNVALLFGRERGVADADRDPVDRAGEAERHAGSPR